MTRIAPPRADFARPTAPGPSSGVRNRPLDALRGLAALAVVLHHFGWGYVGSFGPHNGPMPTFVYGHFGVELFFILSGFVIAGSIERTPSLAAFALNRAARLYPAFVVCCAITLAVVAAGEIRQGVLSTVAILAGLTMVGPLLQVPPIDPSHWSLTYEIAFYALAGLCLRRSPERACALWLAAAFIGSLALPVGVVRVAVLLNLPFTVLFVIGAMLSRAVTGRIRPLGLATLATALGLTGLGPAIDQGGLGANGYVVLILAFSAAVWAAAAGHLNWLGCRLLVALGAISYPLYLVHQIVGYAVIRRLEAGVSRQAWPAAWRPSRSC